MEKLRVIARRELLRIASLNSLSVILKIATGLVTSKVIALFIGPAGMALTGNLRNFLTSVETISTLGFQNGIVKYTTDANSEEALKRVISTVAISLLGIVAILSIILFFGASAFSIMIFDDSREYDFVFRILALALPWYVASMLMVSVLNGLGKFRSVISINMIGNLLSLVVSVVLIYRYRTAGALAASVIAPALMFFVTIFFARQTIGISIFKDFSFDRKLIRNLSEYSLMALFSAVFAPLVFVAIRNHVIDRCGIVEAGWWDGILRISSYYMLFLSTLLAVYFLPNLAKSERLEGMKPVFWNYFQWILPPFAFGLVLLFFARELVIQILFTDDFRGMSNLFFWQLTGDFLKAAALILGYAFFARKLTLAFIVTESFSLTVLWFSSITLSDAYGVEGIVMAHALTYLIYLLVLIWYFRKSLF